jgi:hypothetical protein
MLLVIQLLHELPTPAILFFLCTATSLWYIFHGSGSLRNGCATIGKSQPSQKQVTAKSAESGEPDFASMDARLYGHSFETIFKWKKGFATISLGIFYRSMVLSQPPSCDTVPFRVRYSNTDLAAPFD